jgi:hypothetical protein
MVIDADSSKAPPRNKDGGRLMKGEDVVYMGESPV